MYHSNKNDRIAISIIVLLVMAIPSCVWCIPTAQGKISSRVGIFGCPDSMPPPEVNGVRHGDWKIKCDVLVIRTDIQLEGNILIEFGGSLTLKNISSIEQVVSPFGPFDLVIKSMATLDIEKSTLKIDRLVGENDSAIIFNTSSVRSRGGVESTGALFTVLDSDIKVYSDFYGKDRGAELNITPDVGSIQGSTVLVQGANGPQGSPTALPLDGGNALFRFSGVLAKDSTLIVSGGAGGQGWDSTQGNGQHGARGGDAVDSLMVGDLDGDAIHVLGGAGGLGGIGVSYSGGGNGGSGGIGGAGGEATLTIRSKDGNLTSSTFWLEGGAGGSGGDGGSSKGGQPGDGGYGAIGGKASMSVEVPRLYLLNDSITVQGGAGSNGGSYGKNEASGNNGLAGFGGMGAPADLDLHAYNDLQDISSQLTITGGAGSSGGTGWQFGGDGGHGGNASTTLFSGGSLTIGPDVAQGQSARQPMPVKISSKGGDGGDGGPYEFGAQGNPAYMGRAGMSGDSTVSIDSLGVVDVRRASITSDAGKPAKGRVPTTGLRTGIRHLLLDAIKYVVEDSTADTTFEGLTGHGLGILRNTTVTNGPVVQVWETEPSAMVEVWWHVSVNFTPMFEQQNAEISFFTDINSSAPERTCILHGPWDHCNLMLRSEVVTGAGITSINYTLKGMTDDGVSSSPLNLVLSKNTAVTLIPAGDFYAPHVNITTPEDAVSFTVKDMATGKTTFRGTSWGDLRNPPSDIKNVELDFLNWRNGQVYQFDNRSGVFLMNISQTVYSWTYELDLKAKDGYSPKWPSGSYQVCARSYDGVLWSDDKDTRREGGRVCVNILIFQEETKVPVMQIPNTFPGRIEAVIPADGNYVDVVFSESSIIDLGASGTYYSFQWDFDSDGSTDWTYFPTTGAVPPPADFVYTRTGIYMARLTITDINGDTTTIDTEVDVSKEANQPSTKSNIGVPAFCLPSILIFVICICLIYLVTVLNEKFKFSLLTNVMVPLDRKLRKELKNEDPLRREISDYLRKKPGRYFGKVRSDLELGSVSLARGLMDLEEEGIALHHFEGTHVRLLSTREKLGEEKKGLRPHQRAILKALIRHPLLTPKELAEDIGRSIDFTNHQLYKLEQKGLVTMTPDPEEGPLYRVRPSGRRAGQTRPAPAPQHARPLAEPKPKCPQCGRATKPKWNLCAYCGTPLKEGVVVAPEPKEKAAVETAPPKAPTEQRPKCPGCGRETRPKWNSCAYCGFHLREVTATKTGPETPLKKEEEKPKVPTRPPRPVKRKHIIQERLPPPPIPPKQSNPPEKDAN